MFYSCYRDIKKNLKVVLIFILCVSFMMSVDMVVAASTKDEIEEKEEQQKKLEESQRILEEKLKVLKQEQSDLLEYIKLLDEELDTLTTEALRLEEEKAHKESEIAKTKTMLVEIRAVEDDQYRSMKLRIKYMYEQEKRNVFDMLLGSVGVKEFLNHSEYVKQIVEYDRRMLAEFVETRECAEAYELRLEKELSELTELVESAYIAVSNMEYLLADKDAELTRYYESIAENEDAKDIIDAEWDKLEDDLKVLEEQLKKEEEAKKNQIKYNGGQFIWPLKNYFKITSPYGYRPHPLTKKWQLHNGLDIGAPTGTKIMAVCDGVVATVAENKTAGKYVMINHGNGIYTVYMHCSKLLAKNGQKVKAGDIIALVGSTGSSSAPHLHFSVRLNGTYVDPSPYLGLD